MDETTPTMDQAVSNSPAAQQLDRDGFGQSAAGEEVVLDVRDLRTHFTTRWGTVKAQLSSGATNLEGVFAAGDIVRGASLVVWAIRDGRDSATAVAKYLRAAAAATEQAPEFKEAS